MQDKFGVVDVYVRLSFFLISSRVVAFRLSYCAQTQLQYMPFRINASIAFVNLSASLVKLHSCIRAIFTDSSVLCLSLSLSLGFLKNGRSGGASYDDHFSELSCEPSNNRVTIFTMFLLQVQLCNDSFHIADCIVDIHSVDVSVEGRLRNTVSAEDPAFAKH